MRFITLCRGGLIAAAALIVAGYRTTSAQGSAVGSIERVDPRLDGLIAPDARIERIGEGFDWSEGPVWVSSGSYLLFSDVPMNTIYQWKAGQGVRVFMRPAGYSGPEAPGNELGTNGLTLDARGRLVVADHGNRRIARVDTAKFTTVSLADRYQGARLNSPNDLVYRSNGDLYFTDPPYGLTGLDESPLKEQKANGVYRLSASGELTRVVDDLTFPNGLAFSPDERTLYVAVSDDEHPRWMAYDVAPDGSLSRGRVFVDAKPWAAKGLPGLPDGLKVDRQGNLWATGPGGVHIFAPDGKPLGLIQTGQATANVAFGEDGSTLFITADMWLLRLRTRTKGIGPGLK